MKKYYILIGLIVLFGSFLHWFTISGAATILFPFQGGTGNGVGPAPGDLLVGGTSTSFYARLATGTIFQTLRASSTATYGVSWEFPITSNSCSGSNKASGISSTGTLTCAADETAASPESGWRLNTPFVYLATSTNSVGVGATSSVAKFYVQGSNTASTTVLIQGMTAQTGDLLRVASSGGEVYFQIGPLGIASSSQLRANSSTFGNITDTGLTATRLLQSSAANLLASVADLTAWIAGTASEITVADDGDGTVTISLPTTVDLGASSRLVVISASTTNITASGYGTFPTLNFTNASGTNISVTGYGLFPGLNFTNATGTRIGISIASTTGIEASSTLRVANATVSRCARFDAAGVLVSATGDCTAGDTDTTGGSSSTWTGIMTPRDCNAFPTTNFPSLDRFVGVNQIMEVLNFDGATQETSYCSLAMPSYLGTIQNATITTMWIVSSTSATASSTKWAYGVSCQAHDAAWDATDAFVASTTQLATANKDVQVTTSSPGIVASTFAASNLCGFRIFRDVANDTNAVDSGWVRVALDLRW
jgi:hypothetical protein